VTHARAQNTCVQKAFESVSDSNMCSYKSTGSFESRPTSNMCSYKCTGAFESVLTSDTCSYTCTGSFESRSASNVSCLSYRHRTAVVSTVLSCVRAVHVRYNAVTNNRTIYTNQYHSAQFYRRKFFSIAALFSAFTIL
jgi:hypothetical protein